MVRSAAATLTTPSIVTMSVTFARTTTWKAVPWTVALAPGVNTSYRALAGSA
jgi:hypothetical protein